MPTALINVTELTAEEIGARVGPVPWSRIISDPAPGRATEADVERLRHRENRLCELIDGILVEKAVSEEASFLAAKLITILNTFVLPRHLGWVLAPNGYFRLFGTLLRAPDVAFVRYEQRAGGEPLKRGYSDFAPALAVEIFSPGSTPREIERKRDKFFAAGTELFWVVFSDREEVVVSISPDEHRTLGRDDVLDGGTVLPGFSVHVAELFMKISPKG